MVKQLLQAIKMVPKLIAFFGRANLNYKDMAFLSASLRKKGLPNLVKITSGDVPAVSAGFDLGKLISIDAVNSLKIRGSYGVYGCITSQFLFIPVLIRPQPEVHFSTTEVYPFLCTIPKCESRFDNGRKRLSLT
jgi:hypothetical protein